jgi:hypothetical protein
MKINRQRLKEIIKSAMSEEKEYEEFFRSELEKAGFSSPAEMSDEEKREFFSKIDTNWNAKNEELTGNQHKLDIDGDGDIEADDLAALRAGKKKEKSSNEGNAFGAAVTKAKKEGDKKFKVGGKAYPVKEAELPNAQIPSSIKAKLDHAIDKIQNSKLTYNQKLQVVGKVVDSLGIDKAELSKMSSKLKTTLESVNEQKSKYYVEIDSPREVDSKRVKGEIKSFMKKGARSVDIGLRMNFLTTDPKDMMNKFQKVKNRVYFENDPMRFESVVNEGKFDKELTKITAAVRKASNFLSVGAELKKAGIKYDFSTSMIPMYTIKVPGNTIAIVNRKYAAMPEREVGDIAIGLLEGKIGRSLKVENLSPDVAKHMVGIHKGFQKVEGDGTMIYDTPANAKKAADFLNKKKIAASTDGKYLHIESKTRR